MLQENSRLNFWGISRGISEGKSRKIPGEMLGGISEAVRGKLSRRRFFYDPTRGVCKRTLGRFYEEIIGDISWAFHLASLERF